MQIKHVISLQPQLLYKSVNRTLKPSACEVIAGGFTHKTLLQLIQYNPVALNYKNLLSRLQFWRNILGNDEDALLNFLKNRMLINWDIDKRIIPQMNLLREYGWSEEKLQETIKKYPSVVGLSEEKMKSKINFLIEKAGLNLKFIIDHPRLLTFSLEKRLVPRNHVLGVLKSKGLAEKCDLHAVVLFGDADFVKRFIEPYEKEAPELAKAYNALLKKKCF